MTDAAALEARIDQLETAFIDMAGNLKARLAALEARKLVAVITIAENEKPGMPPMIIFNETLVNADKTPYGQNLPGRLAWQKTDGTYELLDIVRTREPMSFHPGKPQ